MALQFDATHSILTLGVKADDDYFAEMRVTRPGTSADGGYFLVGSDGSDPGFVKMSAAKDGATLQATAATGQTGPLLALYNSSLASVLSVGPDGSAQFVGDQIRLQNATGGTEIYAESDDSDGFVDISATDSVASMDIQTPTGQTAFALRVASAAGGGPKFQVDPSGAITHCNGVAVPITGVPVTDAGIHAALVSLGLITA